MEDIYDNHVQRVEFISIRFAGTDGVSLETAKQIGARWLDNHVSYWYGGVIDRIYGKTMCVPEAVFDYPESVWGNRKMFS